MALDGVKISIYLDYNLHIGMLPVDNVLVHYHTLSM